MESIFPANVQSNSSKGSVALFEPASRFDCGLPEYLQKSVARMIEVNAALAAGERPFLWDCDWCELQSDINVAEVEEQITSEQAWYLREKYLGITRE